MEPRCPQDYCTVLQRGQETWMEPRCPQDYCTVLQRGQETWVEQGSGGLLYSTTERTGDLGGTRVRRTTVQYYREDRRPEWNKGPEDYYSEDYSLGWSKDVRSTITAKTETWVEVRITVMDGATLSAGLIQ
jgi:hypothetical protein